MSGVSSSQSSLSQCLLLASCPKEPSPGTQSSGIFNNNRRKRTIASAQWGKQLFKQLKARGLQVPRGGISSMKEKRQKRGPSAQLSRLLHTRPLLHCHLSPQHTDPIVLDQAPSGRLPSPTYSPSFHHLNRHLLGIPIWPLIALVLIIGGHSPWIVYFYNRCVTFGGSNLNYRIEIIHRISTTW